MKKAVLKKVLIGTGVAAAITAGVLLQRKYRRD